MNKGVRSFFGALFNLFTKSTSVIASVIAAGVLVLTFVFYFVNQTLFLNAFQDALQCALPETVDRGTAGKTNENSRTRGKTRVYAAKWEKQYFSKAAGESQEIFE